MKKVLLTLVLAVGFIGTSTAQNFTIGSSYASTKASFEFGGTKIKGDAVGSIALNAGWVGDITKTVVPEFYAGAAFGTGEASDSTTLGFGGAARIYIDDTFYAKPALTLGFATGDDKELLEYIGADTSVLGGQIGAGASLGSLDIEVGYIFNITQQIEDVNQSGIFVGLKARL